MPDLEPLASAPGAELPRLEVDGPRLVTRAADGSLRAMRLRGLNRSGLQHKPSLARAGFGDPPDVQRELLAWREHWRADILRLPLALDALVPGSDYDADVAALVDAAESAGLYLILELHGLLGDPHPPLPPLPDASAVWTHLAARHGARAHVVFDLWNEPHPESPLGRLLGLWRGPWNAWRARAQALIDVIRAAGAAQTLILVGGVDWAYDLSPLRDPEARLDGHGPLAYATHVYPFKGAARARRRGWRDEWERAFGRVARELPVLVTEFGATAGPAGDPHFGRLTPEAAGAWLAELLGYLDELGLSALAWSAGDRPHLVHTTDGVEARDLATQTLDPFAPTPLLGEHVRAWLRAGSDAARA